MHQPTLQNTY